ncbi:MAG: NifB/NifX family molybdenum-iron cluster-binding protein [Spirochaetales bacterium]|nr:NifB/NifX family molybdenum-iron cluster-binding protein [Spirochaetales bacterium]
MKICITAKGNSLETAVDPRFGRCDYFIIADSETMEFEAIANANAQTTGGSGIAAGQLVSEHNVEAVLTGSVGPNAYRTLEAAAIKIYTGVSGSVMSAIEGFRKKSFAPVTKPTVDSHFGMQ